MTQLSAICFFRCIGAVTSQSSLADLTIGIEPGQLVRVLPNGDAIADGGGGGGDAGSGGEGSSLTSGQVVGLVVGGLFGGLALIGLFAVAAIWILRHDSRATNVAAAALAGAAGRKKGGRGNINARDGDAPAVPSPASRLKRHPQISSDGDGDGDSLSFPGTPQTADEDRRSDRSPGGASSVSESSGSSSSRRGSSYSSAGGGSTITSPGGGQAAGTAARLRASPRTNARTPYAF